MTRRRRKSKRIYWIVILILLLIAGIIGYKVWEGYFKDDEPAKESSSSKEERDEQEEKPEDGDDGDVNDTEEPEEEPLEKKTEQFDGNDPNTTNELTGVITYAGVSGGNLMIRVNIDQYLASGTCALELKRDGSSIYNDTVEIIDSASTATCKGFNVPTNQLGSGKTNINIMLTAEGKTGIIKGEVNL